MTTTPTSEPSMILRRPVRGGGGFLDPSPLEKEGFNEFVHLRLTRRCGRKIIVAPPSPDAAAKAGEDGKAEANPLVRKIARAFRYREMMDSGEYPTQGALAAKVGINRGYLSRLIRLTLLAPDIITAIVEGREPSGLSVETLMKGDYPDDWPGQRAALGFPAVAG